MRSPGKVLADELQKAIEKCDLCLYVATENSINSTWCSAEVGAFWGSNKPILVYLTDQSLKDQLPPQVNGNLHVTDRADIVRSVSDLLESSPSMNEGAKAIEIPK